MDSYLSARVQARAEHGALAQPTGQQWLTRLAERRVLDGEPTHDFAWAIGSHFQAPVALPLEIQGLRTRQRGVAADIRPTIPGISTTEGGLGAVERGMLREDGWDDSARTYAVDPSGTRHFISDRPILVQDNSRVLAGDNVDRFAWGLERVVDTLRMFDRNAELRFFPVGEDLVISDAPTRDYASTEHENNLVNLNTREVLEGRGPARLVELALLRSHRVEGRAYPSANYAQEVLGFETPGLLSMRQFNDARAQVLALAQEDAAALEAIPEDERAQAVERAKLEVLNDRAAWMRRLGAHRDLLSEYWPEGLEPLADHRRADGSIDYEAAARSELRLEGVRV